MSAAQHTPGRDELCGLIAQVRAAYPALGYQHREQAKRATKQADAWLRSFFFNEQSSEHRQHCDRMRATIAKTTGAGRG